MLCFAACTSAQRPVPTPTAPSPAVAPASAAATASPLPRLNGLPSPSPSPASPDALVALAVADASQRTGVDPSAVRVVSVTPNEWPDRSLGCPKPGTGYAQVITPGYLIILQAGDQQLEYHTDQDQVVLCGSS